MNEDRIARLYGDCVRFHGHDCPLLALGVRVCETALERLKLEIAAMGGVVRDAEYGADITLRTAFPAGTAETFQLRLTELSAGSLTMTAAGEEFLPGPREEAN